MSNIFLLSLHILLRQGLPLTLEHVGLARMAVQLALEVHLCPQLIPGTGIIDVAVPGFYLCTRDTNSGPHSSTAGILATEFPPHLLRWGQLLWSPPFLKQQGPRSWLTNDKA